MEIEAIMKKYPDRVPVYVRKSPTCKSDLNDLEKHKYLIPTDMTMGSFLCVIRKHIKISPTQAIFIFVAKKNVLVPNSSMFGELYNTHKEDDLMLHLDYTSENTFG